MTLLNMLLQAAEAAASLNLGTLSAPIGAAIVIIGAGLSIGKIGTSALEAVARQPEAVNDIRMLMIIMAALIEGASLFAIVICLMAL